MTHRVSANPSPSMISPRLLHKCSPKVSTPSEENTNIELNNPLETADVRKIKDRICDKANMLNAKLLITKAETKTFVSYWPGRLASPLGSTQALDRVALLHLETDLPNDALLRVGTILRVDKESEN